MRGSGSGGLPKDISSCALDLLMVWLFVLMFIMFFSCRFLENEIHKTNLKLMEGETIKKKYTSILDMLRYSRRHNRQVFFRSTQVLLTTRTKVRKYC